MSSKLSTVLLSVACAAMVGGGAYAIGAASASKTISACANKTTGVLRLASAKKCTTKEKKVSWNKQGPPGAGGSAGSKGDKGDMGAPGTANLGEMTTTYADEQSTIGPGHPDKSTISTAPLPAGSYAIQAAVNVLTNLLVTSIQTATATCTLSISTDMNLGFDQRQIGNAAATSSGTIASSVYQSASFILTADVPEGARAQLLCDADNSTPSPIILLHRFITTERLKSQTQAGATPVNT